MSALQTIEIKAFVPARDFVLSQRFYTALGFTRASSGHGVAYFHHGHCSFLLQDCDDAAHAAHSMLHLLVEDVEAWWKHVEGLDLPRHYPGVRLTPPQDQPWAMRDFTLTDPAGVLWRIAQNLDHPRSAP